MHDRLQRSSQQRTGNASSFTTAAAAANAEASNALPDGWEESTDPKSGKTFYINHLERKTTWDRPCATNPSKHNTNALATPFGNDASDYYSNLNTVTLNKFGSHSKWVDPTTGTRYCSSRANTGLDISHEGQPPLLEFSTVQVPDLLRSSCPSCNVVFSTLKRRHHCRLCGDVFCDACSQGRAVLPLEGEEFNKSVRVCDLCLGDVKK